MQICHLEIHSPFVQVDIPHQATRVSHGRAHVNLVFKRSVFGLWSFPGWLATLYTTCVLVAVPAWGQPRPKIAAHLGITGSFLRNVHKGHA